MDLVVVQLFNIFPLVFLIYFITFFEISMFLQKYFNILFKNKFESVFQTFQKLILFLGWSFSFIFWTI